MGEAEHAPVGVPPEEAIEWHRKRLRLSDPEFRELEDQARRDAFYVSGAAHADVVADVWKAIDDAVAKGTTLADFKAAVRTTLESEWAGTVANPGARLETVFRTNVQAAYNSGRWNATQAVREDRPYIRAEVIDDERTCEQCAPLLDVILPANDPFWRTHWFPLHHNDRCTTVTLTQEEAEEEGVAPEAPAVEASDGFGLAPGEDEPVPAWLATKREDYPDPIRAEADRRGLFDAPVESGSVGTPAEEGRE